MDRGEAADDEKTAATKVSLTNDMHHCPAQNPNAPLTAAVSKQLQRYRAFELRRNQPRTKIGICARCGAQNGHGKPPRWNRESRLSKKLVRFYTKNPVSGIARAPVICLLVQV